MTQEKNCPRCDVRFECKVGNIKQCRCATIKLNDQERQFIAQQYDDCLCAKCMEAMKRAYRLQPVKKGVLKVFGKPFNIER